MIYLSVISILQFMLEKIFGFFPQKFIVAPTLPLRSVGAPLTGTACRPARPSGHSPGTEQEGRYQGDTPP